MTEETGFSYIGNAIVTFHLLEKRCNTGYNGRQADVYVDDFKSTLRWRVLNRVVQAKLKWKHRHLQSLSGKFQSRREKARWQKETRSLGWQFWPFLLQ